MKAIHGGAVELYHDADGSKKLETTSYGAFVNGRLSLDDSNQITLGDSMDLRIYHDGNHSYVADNGAGELRLASFNGSGVRITKSDSETLANFTNDGAVELYHDNSKKAETVTGGFTITGVCTATSFAGDGSALTGIAAGSTTSVFENPKVLSGNHTINSNNNALVAGEFSVGSYTLTIPSGSTLL